MSITFEVPSWHVLIPVFLIGSIFLCTSKRKFTYPQYVLLVTFFIYVMGVIHFTLFPLEINIGKYANQAPWYSSVNPIPIFTLDIKTFVLNVIMFLPLGAYLPFLKNKYHSVKDIARIGFFMSGIIEIIQLCLRIFIGNGRSMDVNDLIANTLGCIVGYLVIQKVFQINCIRTWLQHFVVYGVPPHHYQANKIKYPLK
ncbi:VanZ family protein [Bacillus toyonensis]|uniref:VanZ family protein n=1 Tax=Bacillus toyonensis TaxID=155322 RepID=UPI000BF811D7|nr:VanZ family protein [Bacillus toyonensis]MBC2683536.1 VanZ family protein [Bacillus toyonensis]MBH0358359.1 VanZ family protein [Bacillus toyonensis biovar Thuringiensis]PGC99645.1 teicoplanin resistance protein VanZ [Bacillus toyonensis]TBX41314.1 VanZ family protein [Bacillus toyonensis]